MEPKEDQISICVFFGVVPDALRPQQRPANIMYSFLLSSGKKGGGKWYERMKQCQTLQERLNK